MLYFRNDYSQGACREVLDALMETNMIPTAGYGTDQFCAAAAETIRDLCEAPSAQVHFLVGGTQVNKTAIGAFLRPYEAVIAADTGHICVHETGAVEQNGHKILPLPTPDGKLRPEQIRETVERHCDEHMVLPRLVYISNTTEVGTVYRLAELDTLHDCCRELGLLLYCDGARLGSAMTVEGADTSFADYARLCDAFTIGGTKNGLLFGEALVLTNGALFPHFRHAMKQQGAILAKGRLLGVQFDAVLRGGAYLRLARHANAMADKLRRGLLDLGYRMAVDSPSNQLFPILTPAQEERLREVCAYEIQSRDERGVCVRFVTSWATTEEDVDGLLAFLQEVRV